MTLKETTRKRYFQIYREVLKGSPPEEIRLRFRCSDQIIRRAVNYFKEKDRLSTEEEMQIQIDSTEAKLSHLREKVKQIEKGSSETEEVIEGDSRKRVKKKRVYNWSAAVGYWREIRENEKELMKLKGLLEGKKEGGERDDLDDAIKELETEGDLQEGP